MGRAAGEKALAEAKRAKREMMSFMLKKCMRDYCLDVVV